MVVPDKPGLEVDLDSLPFGLESRQLWPVYVVDAVDGARKDGVAHLCVGQAAAEHGVSGTRCPSETRTRIYAHTHK